MSEHVIVARMEGSGQTRISDRPILELPESMVLWTGEGDYEAWTGMDIATGRLVKMETPWVKDILDFDYWTDYFQSLDPSEWTCPGSPWPPNRELNPVSLQLIAAVPTFEPQGMALLVAVSTKRYGATCYLWFRGAGGELRRKRLESEWEHGFGVWMTPSRGGVYLLERGRSWTQTIRVSLPDMVEERGVGWNESSGFWCTGSQQYPDAWGEQLAFGIKSEAPGAVPEDQWGTRNVITGQVRMYPPAWCRNLVVPPTEESLSVDYENDRVLPSQCGPDTQVKVASLFMTKVSPDVAVDAIVEEVKRGVYTYGVPKCGYSWGNRGPYPYWLVVPDVPGLCVEFPQGGGVDICFYGPSGIRYVATHYWFDPRNKRGPGWGPPGSGYYGIKRIPIPEALCYDYGVVNGPNGYEYSGCSGGMLLMPGLQFSGCLGSGNEYKPHETCTVPPSVEFRARSINLKTGRSVGTATWGAAVGTLPPPEKRGPWGLLYDPGGKGGATVFPLVREGGWGEDGQLPRILPLYVGTRGTLSPLPQVPAGWYPPVTWAEDESGYGFVPVYAPVHTRFLKGRGTIEPYRCFFPLEEAGK